VKQEHVLDELSAYIDGEAQEPARIARHLQFCELCARRHMELLRLSANLRGMAQPETRPEFVTRVVACAAAEQARPETRRAGRWVLTLPQWGMAAAAAIFIVAAGLNSWQLMHPGTAPVVESPQPVAVSGEEALAAAFEGLIAQGVDPALLSPPEETAEEPAAEVPLEAVLDLLADNSGSTGSWEDAYAGEEAGNTMESLDQEEADAFLEVLREYVQELNDQKDTKGLG